MLSENPERIGLIGLGLMGSAMARQFLGGGFGVVGHDLVPERTQALASLGGTPASSPAEVARSCRRIVLSLPETTEVKAVLEGLSETLRAGQVVIDTTTGDPAFATEVSARLEQVGVAYLDAAVSGSSAQVLEAEAIVMAGGTLEAFESCRDLFGRIARRVYRVGLAGSGLRMKLVSNLILGLNRAALAESLTLARALGLELEAVLTVLRDSPAYSRVMDTKGEKMIRGDYAPQARLSQHHKDVRLMLELAERNRLALPLSETHQRILEEAERGGLGGLDNSAIFEAYARQAASRLGEAAGDLGGGRGVDLKLGNELEPDPPAS